MKIFIGYICDLNIDIYIYICYKKCIITKKLIISIFYLFWFFAKIALKYQYFNTIFNIMIVIYFVYNFEFMLFREPDGLNQLAKLANDPTTYLIIVTLFRFLKLMLDRLKMKIYYYIRL